MHSFLDALLFQNGVTHHALLSAIFLATAGGVIGSFTLLKKQALMGDALAHAALPGVAGGFLVVIFLNLDGGKDLWLMVGAGIAMGLAALTIMAFRKTRLYDDVILAYIIGFFFAVGVVLLSYIQTLPVSGQSGLTSWIFGQVATLTRGQSAIIIASSMGILTTVLVFRRLLIITCFDRVLSRKWLWLGDFLLVGLTTIMITVSLPAVGLLLVVAFLVLPAATACLCTKRMGAFLTASACVGGVSAWVGGSLSMVVSGMPSGASMVLVAGLIFFVTLVLKSCFG